MADLGPITITVETTGSDSASASFRSVFEHLASSRGALERVAELFPDFLRAESGSGGVNLIADIDDLFLCEPVNSATVGAHKVVFWIKPSKRYVEFVTAISRDGNLPLDFNFHGWPILSVGDRTPTVDRTGRGAILSPEGAR